MPTGYTSVLDDGEVSFRDFVMRCARGMGALVMMREEPMNAPIPELFEPQTKHYEDEIARMEKEIEKVYGLSDDELLALLTTREKERMSREQKNAEDSRAAVVRYNAMRKLVADWKPPSPDHEGLKLFMLEQLSTGFPFEYEEPMGELIIDLRHWRQDRLAHLRGEIARYQRLHQEEIERTESRNVWLKQLRESLGV